MKTYISLLIPLIFLACVERESVQSGPVDASLPSDPPRTEEAPSSDEEDSWSGDSVGECGRFDVFRIDVDGGYFEYKIPLPCDPLWKFKDRGDPPPRQL